MADKRLKIDITAFDKTRAAFRSVTAGITKIGSMAKRAGLAIAGIGLAFGYPLKKMAEAVDETGKLSRQLGMSVKNLEAFKLAADLGGSSLSTFARASKQVSKAVFDFVKRGTGEAKDAFQALGITTGDLIPIMNDNVAVFDLISEKFRAMENGSVKTAVAMKVFGAKAVEMLSVFEEGSDSIKKAREEAMRFGLVLGEEQVKNVEHANDEFTRLIAVFKGIGKQITGVLFPKLGEVATMVREKILDSIEKSFGSVENFAIYTVGKIMDTFNTMAKFMRGLGKIIGGLVTVLSPVFYAVSKITEKIFWVLEKSMDLVAFFKKQAEDEARKDFFALEGKEDPGGQEKKEDDVDKVIGNFSEGFGDIKEALGDFNEFLAGVVFDKVDEGVAKTEKFKLGFDNLKTSSEEAFSKASEGAGNLSDDLDGAADKVDKVSLAMERLGSASNEAGRVIAKNFEDSIFKAKSFEDALGSVADQLLRLAFQKTVTDPLSEFLGTFASNYFSGGGASKAPATAPSGGGGGGGSLMYAANGAAFNSGRVIPFAKGGVVSEPTNFGLSGNAMGLMAEKEPEAILPLKRGGDGRLGVVAVGGTGKGTIVNVNVIDQRKEGATPEVSEGTDSQGNRQISVLIRDEVKKGFADGAFDKNLKVFGLSRGGLGRA